MKDPDYNINLVCPVCFCVITDRSSTGEIMSCDCGTRVGVAREMTRDKGGVLIYEADAGTCYGTPDTMNKPNQVKEPGVVDFDEEEDNKYLSDFISRVVEIPKIKLEYYTENASYTFKYDGCIVIDIRILDTDGEEGVIPQYEYFPQGPSVQKTDINQLMLCVPDTKSMGGADTIIINREIVHRNISVSVVCRMMSKKKRNKIIKVMLALDEQLFSI